MVSTLGFESNAKDRDSCIRQGEYAEVTGELPARHTCGTGLTPAIQYDQDSHVCYNRIMRKVNIGDLKARLSEHIRIVRDGEEVLVCDRNKPVARIVPCAANDQPEGERRLIARGLLTPPLKK